MRDVLPLLVPALNLISHFNKRKELFWYNEKNRLPQDMRRFEGSISMTADGCEIVSLLFFFLRAIRREFVLTPSAYVPAPASLTSIPFRYKKTCCPTY